MASSIDVRALKDDAVAAMALGDVRAALGFYQRIAVAEPHDPRWIMKVGESHRTLGETADAVAAFRDAALAYKREGFDLKAVAACRVLLQLAPGDPDAKGLIDTLSPRTSLTPGSREAFNRSRAGRRRPRRHRRWRP